MMLLAHELEKLDFSVFFAGSRPYTKNAQELNLKSVVLTGQDDCSEKSKNALIWDHQISFKDAISWNNSWRTLLLQNFSELCNLVEPNDVLITSSNLLVGDLVATVKHAQWIEVGLNPCCFLTSEKKLNNIHAESWQDGLKVTRKFICTKYRINGPIQSPIFRLHAVPENFCDSNFRYEDCKRTGFWMAKQKSNFTPNSTESVVNTEFKFKKIILSLSSQPVKRPEIILQQHIDVAKIINLPLFVVKEKAFTSCNFKEKILRWIPAQSIDTHLNQSAIYFNHGGIGSIATGLRAKATLFIEAFSAEQLMNAYLCSHQNLAFAVNREKFDPNAIARIIRGREKQIQNNEVINNIRKDNWFLGLNSSVDIIKNHLTKQCPMLI